MNWVQVETLYGWGTVIGRLPDIDGDQAILVAIRRESLVGMHCCGPVKNMAFRWCQVHQKATVGRCMECVEVKVVGGEI